MKILIKRFFIILLTVAMLIVPVPTGTATGLSDYTPVYQSTPAAQSSPFSIQNTANFIPYSDSSPSSFKNVTYKTRAGVIKANGTMINLLKNARMGDQLKSSSAPSTLAPVEKLKQNTFVKSSVMASQFPGYKRGSIILDETSGIAAKVMDEVKAGEYVAENSVMLARPQINEVLEDINIPQQTVMLNRGNIGGMTSGVKQSIVSRAPDRLPHMEQYASASTQNLIYNGTPEIKRLSSAEYGKHLKNPLVEFEFKNIPLAAYTAEGISVMVNLDGYIGVDSISVAGHYGFSGGYEFVATTGEEIDLKVTSAINVQKELVIPLFGIDIPAGIAHASGGLFLIVGMDGNFTLVTEATQWLSVKAGIKGGTFLGIPTGFYPVFEPIDKGFDVNVTFFGSINGYIKAGPMVQLQLFGWDVAGAGVLGGAGLKCALDNTMISADVYATLEVYALLIGNRLNILNSKIVLLQLRIPNTEGYNIQYYNADAYNGTIWGKISKDYGGMEGVKPFSGDLVIQVKRNGKEVGLHSTHSNSEGIFGVQDINSNEKFYKGDEIKVVNVDGKTINSGVITPTLPFNQVNVEYADFFNDSVKGQVTPAVVKNWLTGEKSTVKFAGTIGFTVTKDPSAGGSSYEIDAVTSDSEGVFSVDSKTKPIDLKPKDKLKAKLLYNGFTVNSADTLTSVDIIAQRLIEDKGKSDYTENGRVIEKRNEKEYFLVFNKRGDKQVNQDGIYTGTYHYYDKNCFIVDPDTGKTLVLAKKAGEKVFSQVIEPKGPGGSICENDFITEWAWAAKSRRISGLTSSINASASDKAKRVLTLPLVSGIFLRYESGMIKEDYDAIKEYLDRPTAGIDAIRKKGVLTIEYEGAKIEIKDPNDTPKSGSGSKTVYITDPFARSLSETIWDRVINPMDIAANPGVSLQNVSQLAAWSRSSASSMVKKGIMNTDSQGKLMSNQSISRGEFAAFLTRAFRMAPTISKTGFSDVSTFYPYRCEINTAVKYGLMSGVSSTKFSPFGTLTREEAAVITMNALKKMLSGKLAIPASSRNVTFKDSKSITASSLSAVRELSSLGLMYKSPDGNFKPKSNLTFEDTAYLLEKVNNKMK